MPEPTRRVGRWSGVLTVWAACECGWESDAKNAIANAKRHAQATGHVVHASQEIMVTYAPEGMPNDEVFERIRYPSWQS